MQNVGERFANVANVSCFFLLTGKPLSLQASCRIAIRRHIGYKRLVALNCLPVPRSLSAYLLDLSEI